MALVADNQHPTCPADLAELARLAARWLELELGRDAEISLLLVDDPAMAALNQQWLGHEGPTDVISFPQQALVPGCYESLEPGDLLGDVVISVDTATAQAEDAHQAGWSLDCELALLLAHGLLHLCGYDDLTPEARAVMQRREDELLGAVGLGPVPRGDEGDGHPARPNLRRYVRSFRHAIEGVLDAYRSQRHMRVHFVFMGINAILAMVYKLEALEVALLMVCITLVVFAEMLNTVVEATLNIVTETYHPLTRFAKDVAAGAVLVTAVNACLVGAIIYFHPARIDRLRSVWVEHTYVDDSAYLRAFAMSVLLLIILTTAGKVGKPAGSVLHGGAISGHTAFAFCFATCLFFLVRNTVYVYLAVLLAGGIALMVAQLRLHDANHQIKSVIYGAALGVAVPLLVFQWLAQATRPVPEGTAPPVGAAPPAHAAPPPPR